ARDRRCPGGPGVAGGRRGPGAVGAGDAGRVAADRRGPRAPDPAGSLRRRSLTSPGGLPAGGRRLVPLRPPGAAQPPSPAAEGRYAGVRGREVLVSRRLETPRRPRPGPGDPPPESAQ